MGHTHSHGRVTGRRLWLSVILTSLFVVGEGLAGWRAHSLALLSDAGHNFADALALVLCWYANHIASRPPNENQTFGYHRAGILAAMVNAVSLVVIALLIFWEAIQRLQHPEPVHGGLMIGVALVAILLNAAISLGLRGEAKHDLNVRSAYVHMAGDALSALGVVIAGIIVALTGASIADPVVSFLIGGFILWSSWGIVTESVSVLMESSPQGIDMAAVEGAIKDIHGVLNVHDLHVWTVASEFVACSCHILVAEQSIRSGEQVLKAAAEMLDHRFQINHTTIQVEVEGCELNDMYCTMIPRREEHKGHDHDGHESHDTNRTC